MRSRSFLSRLLSFILLSFSHGLELSPEQGRG